MKKHYVVFISPGSFVDEMTSKPIESWDTKAAIALAETIVERYGAKPYAFMFKTYDELPDVVDEDGHRRSVEARELAASGRHYIDGTVLTRDDVVALKDPKLSIMESNMRNVGSEIVCRTTRSYTHHGVFAPGDCVVDAKGEVVERGDSERLAAYRARVKAEHDAEMAEYERKWAEKQKR